MSPKHTSFESVTWPIGNLESPQAEPVAAFPNRTDGSLTRIQRVDGVLRFGPEAPVAIYARAQRSVELASGEKVVFSRFEVKAEPTVCRPGQFVVTTEWPYGSGLVAYTQFKPPAHTQRAQRSKTTALDLPSAIAHLDAARHDPWETGCRVTAGFSFDSFQCVLEDGSRNDSRSGTALGLCFEAPEKLVEELWTDPECGRLKQMADRGTLKVGPRGMKRTPTQEALDDAGYLLMVAAHQALAGPVEPGNWHGVPVSKLVRQIFEGHMDSRTRRRH
jgi:hypothetical protein